MVQTSLRFLANTNNQKQLNQQQKAQEDMYAQQQAMMEEMMNQPIYNPKQAALPKIQERPKTPDPMPVAPAPPPIRPPMGHQGGQLSDLNATFHGYLTIEQV